MPGEALNDTTVASPISAGVDGTDSASGVHHPTTHHSDNHLEDILTPRSPGSSHRSQQPQWFGVTLDGRILKTPMGKTLAVPSETLAHGIAAEWNAQEKHLKPTDMPLMTLACTTLDQAAYHPHVYREQSLRFLPTDTVGKKLVMQRVQPLLQRTYPLIGCARVPCFVSFRLVFGRTRPKIASSIVGRNKLGKNFISLFMQS